MSWAYDSKLPTPQRTRISDAFITKLAPLGVANGGYLEAIIPIGFGIKDRNDDLGVDLPWQELNGRTPAIAVYVGKLTGIDGGSAERSHGPQQVELYIVSSHRRGLTEGRTEGDAAAAQSNANDPGLNATLELARNLIDEVKGESDVTPTDAAALRSRFSWKGLGLLLEANREGLTVNSILQEGNSREEAKHQVDLLFAFLDKLGTIENSIRYEPERYQLEFRFGPASANR